MNQLETSPVDRVRAIMRKLGNQSRKFHSGTPNTEVDDWFSKANEFVIDFMPEPLAEEFSDYGVENQQDARWMVAVRRGEWLQQREPRTTERELKKGYAESDISKYEAEVTEPDDIDPLSEHAENSGTTV